MSYTSPNTSLGVVLMAYMMVKNGEFISNRFHAVHQ